MNHAIVLACGNGFTGENLGSYITKPVAQVPQIKRILINAQRAGISSFTICVDKKDPSLENVIERDSRIESDVIWSEDGDIPKLDKGSSFVIPSNILINTDSFQEFINKNRASNGNISVLSRTDSASDGNGAGDFQNYGLVYAGSREISELLQTPDLNEWLRHYIAKDKVHFINSEKGYWMNLNGNRESISDAEQLIFSNVGKTATGWIARNINGRISLPISKHLIKTPLTPNMISVLINVIGMLCGPFYALGHPVLGALFMQIATVLDRCDGEVARIKLMETKRGQWIDTISDQVTVLSFIIGSALGYYYESGSNIAIVLGGINLSIFVFFLAWSLYFISKYTDSGSLVAYFQVDNFVDTKKTSFLRKFIAFLRPLGRRNVYSLAFLIFAIIGGYPLVVGVLTFSLILFLLHQLEDVIKIFKIKI